MKTKPDKKFFKKLGDEVRDKIQVSAQKKGEDHKGKPFKDYSKTGEGVGWRTLEVKKGIKKAVFIDSYANRKKAGKAVPKGQSVASRSIKPDLTLTGTMWRNMANKPFNNRAEVGWTSRQQAQKVQGLADGGRVIFSDKVHPDVDKLIKRMLKKEIDKNVKVSKPKDKTIRIG